MLRVVAATLCTVCLMSSVGRAQEPAPDKHLELARELVAASFAPEAFGAILDPMAAAIGQEMRPQLNVVLKREATPQDLALLTQTIRESIETAIPKSALDDAIARILVKHLSMDDIAALLEFHRTPLGMRMAAMQRRLITESASVGEELVASRRDDLMKELIARLTKAFQPQ